MSNSKGLFGKLPGHGDFIQRELPASFVTPWDEWLQRAVHGSRELIGEGWLDYYLTSPIWRFALSAGVLDERAWGGVLVPSVDSVGRYFPLTMAVPLEEKTNPFTLQVSAQSWYGQLSDVAIEALQNALQADQLLARFPEFSADLPATAAGELGGGALMVGTAGEGAGIADSYPALLNDLYRQQYPSFSLWWCGGSQYLAPTTLLSPGLPEPTLYCSMLGAPGRQW